MNAGSTDIIGIRDDLLKVLDNIPDSAWDVITDKLSDKLAEKVAKRLNSGKVIMNPKYISQNKAYKKYTRAKVERWKMEGLLDTTNEGRTIYYYLQQLEDCSNSPKTKQIRKLK